MAIHLKTEILGLIKKLGNKIDQKTQTHFLDFLQKYSVWTKNEGNPHHLCAFFLPIAQQESSIFLGHHIKADDWLPPGGHLEKGELPQETVRREFKEELSYNLKPYAQIIPFALSVKTINRTQHNCLTHYDLWYLVETTKIPFQFDRKEFYHAQWFKIEEGIKRVKNPLFKKTLAYLRTA